MRMNKWTIRVTTSRRQYTPTRTIPHEQHYQNWKHYINYANSKEHKWTTLSRTLMNNIIKTWNTTSIMRTRKNTNFAITCTRRRQYTPTRTIPHEQLYQNLKQEQPKTKTVHTYHKTKTVHAYKNYPSWTTLSELETLHQLCELERTQMNNIIKNTHEQHYQNLKHYINYANSKEHKFCNHLHKTKTVHAYKNYPSWTTLSELETGTAEDEDSTHLPQDEDSTRLQELSLMNNIIRTWNLPQDEDSTRLQELSLMNNIIRTWNTTSIMRTRKNTNEQHYHEQHYQEHSWTTLSELKHYINYANSNEQHYTNEQHYQEHSWTLMNSYHEHYQEHSWTTLSELETLHQLCELELNNIIKQMNNIIRTHEQHYHE